MDYILTEVLKFGDYPNRVIVTDDPLRTKMLAAHHLENAALFREQGDELIYLGSYKGAAIALISAGFERAAVLPYPRDSKQLGAIEVIYIGECVSSVRRYPLRSVILADGGDQDLLARSKLAASRYDIPISVRAVSDDVTDSVTRALYERARECGIAALSILTVSENIETGEHMEEHERRSRLYAASRLAFETLAADK